LLNIDVTTPVSGLVVQPHGGYLEQDLVWEIGEAQNPTVENVHAEWPAAV
jgi:hypothetical protein